MANRCIGFCDVKNILHGTTGSHPSECEDDFPKIVECMAGKLLNILLLRIMKTIFLYCRINVWCPILILPFIFQLDETTYLVVRKREFLMYVRICVSDRTQFKPMTLGVRCRVRHIQLPHWFVLRREWVSEYFNSIL